MKTPSSVLDLFSLAPESLIHENSLNDVLAEVEGVLTEENAHAATLELMTKPGLLEFLISASPRSANILCTHLMTSFPKSAHAFTSSLACGVLQQLSPSLFFLRRSFATETSNTIDEYRKAVALAAPVLAAIPLIISSDTNPDSTNQIGARIKGKRGKHANFTVPHEPFQKYGVAIPSTTQAAEQLAAGILVEQKWILEFFLSVIRRHACRSIFKDAYILPQMVEVPAPITNKPIKEVVTLEDTDRQNRSAYPMVQPMKAALYFDSADGFGEWRVMVSTRATQNIREARRTNASTFKIIVKKIKQLSNGHFSDDNQKRLNGRNIDVPIYEAKMTRDLRLVYQVDCMPEYDSDVERQVLRVFGIYTHAQLDARLWDSISSQLSRRGKEYRRRCNFRNRPYHAGDNVVMPASFPAPGPAEEEPESSVLDLPVDDLEELHSLLVLEKFVAFSQALLNSIIADKDVAHVFSVTPQEKDIIEYNSSCYVLGRSGTGKTTTMLFKMLGIERVWKTYSSADIPKPRQLFVTQSRVLAGRVEEYFSKLLESLTTASHSTQDLAKDAKAMEAQQKDAGLVDLDDEAIWRNDLPDRFSLLEDRHFPLFVTFDRLCQLLETDFFYAHRDTQLLDNRAAFDDVKDTMLIEDIVDSQQAHIESQYTSCISYDVFKQAYWPHFSQSLTKGLNPSLVFSEFMGVIKGSEQALDHAGGFLDQKTYCNLSHRSQSTFAHQRNTIYAVFQLYLKRKRDRGECDPADRTHSLLHAISQQGIPGKKIDFLYVDEVQDNLLIDALLLRSMCRNPDGLFWAGDTAQTISVGSSFKFNDLKAFLFRIEEKNVASGEILHNIVQPRSFQLAVNYRSHGGIVNCAHSVVDLITRFWPHAIDILAQEKGIVDGLKPVFFHGWNSETVRYEQFLFGASGGHIEFGAQQCILVRDESARKQLRAQVGDVGLIMTLYESKGLEFNDVKVLLYNFFQDSTVDVSQWRLVLNTQHGRQGNTLSTPRFNELHHAGVCSELKFLYVAITRARKNLWIVDCSEKGEPMRKFWIAKQQVNNCTPGDDVPRLAVSSTPEEWATFGRSLFQHKRYLQAAHCFERADMHREVAVANAYSLREQARVLPSGYHQKAAFLLGAQSFIECANSAKKEKNAYFRIAGECFVSHGDNDKAAQAFHDGEAYTLAAKLYRKGGRLDDAISIIRAHQNQMQAEVVDSIVGVARILYFKNFEIQKAVALFPSIDDALSFVEDYALDIAHATLLQQVGRYAEAADVHISEGRIKDGIEIFLSNLGNQECTAHAVDYVLRALWRHLSFGVSMQTAKLDVLLGHWLGLAARLSVESLKDCDRDEIYMFQAIIAQDYSKLQHIGLKFYKEDNKPAALLCLDHIFARPPRIQCGSIAETISSLEMFYGYTRLLHDIACLPNPCNGRSVQKLFAFEIARENIFSVAQGALLHRQVGHQGALFFNEKNGKLLVPGSELARVLKGALGERLRSRVMEENKICRAAAVFTPCPHGTMDACSQSNCPRDHFNPATMTPDHYNERVRIHFQQIQIFQTLHFVDLGPERDANQRYWIDRLYEAIYPRYQTLGCRANLDLSEIPGADRGITVVKDWAKHIIYTVEHQDCNFLTTFTRSAILSFDFDRTQALGNILRAKYMSFRRPPTHLVRNHGVYIMQDLVASLHGERPWHLSSGILFVRHAISEMLNIDISVLCDIIENICGALATVKRYRHASTLHNVILPKSWLLNSSKNIKLHKFDDTGMYWIMVDPLLTLLGRLHTGLDLGHLFNDRASDHDREIFASRICRALCLMGHSIGNFQLKDKIGFGIGSLNKYGGIVPKIYRQYFEAVHWGHLAAAAKRSLSGSTTDEMIQLLHEPRIQGPLRPDRSVQQILFRSLDEITGLLAASNPAVSRTIALSASNPKPDNSHNDRSAADDTLIHQYFRSDSDPIIDSPRNHYITSSDFTHVTAGTEIEQIDEHNIAEQLDQNPEATAENLAQSMDSRKAEDILVASSDQIRAASIIQAVYRHKVLRRGNPRSKLSEARSRLFIACWLQSEKVIWPRRRCRLLFLGPLPHLLLCLEVGLSHALDLKKKAKRRMNLAQHQDLEDVQAKMMKANCILQDLQEIQKALEPKSAVHKNADLRVVRNLVLDAETKLRSLACVHDFQEDLRLAMKGFLTEAPQKKKQKPMLYIDDDA